MDGYPTRITVSKSSRGYRVTAKFRGRVGRAFTKQIITSRDRQELRRDLEAYLTAAATDAKLVDVGEV